MFEEELVNDVKRPNLYKYLTKISIHATYLYIIPHDTDKYLITAMSNKDVLYSVIVSRSRVVRMLDVYRRGNIYELSADANVVYSDGTKKRVRQAELVIRVSKDTILKEIK